MHNQTKLKNFARCLSRQQFEYDVSLFAQTTQQRISKMFYETTSIPFAGLLTNVAQSESMRKEPIPPPFTITKINSNPSNSDAELPRVLSPL